MTRHLAHCGQPAQPSPEVIDLGTKREYHLVVEGRHSRSYWLHLAVPMDAQLGSLDKFLRKIWLECCGHLSAFSIDGVRYASSPTPDLGEASMRASLGAVLDVGARFFHEYDYGSTTELVLKMVGLRERMDGKPGVRLLARNSPPEIFCGECGTKKLATEICVECMWTGGGWLCEECADNHPCDPAMLLPVFNSPRVGVCGYTG